MARLPGESPFRAPILRAISVRTGLDDGSFERELLGFCITALLDRRAALNPSETRTFWAERLGMSKSHVSKMVEFPSAGFIDGFDLAMTELETSSPVQPNTEHGLRPLLSNFYAELRPSEWREETRSVLSWFARYQPVLSQQLSDVLFRSEVALERCTMLEKSGLAELDPSVVRSIRELLVVVSGPYGASMIAHQQCAELGLMVPSVFFDEVEKTLFHSPVGFRVLRTLDRFIKLWRGLGPDPNVQRREEINLRLALLLRRISRSSERLPFIDPYPGAEWAISLARDCYALEEAAIREGAVKQAERQNRADAKGHAYRWLERTFNDDGSSDRARLFAAWVVADKASEENRLDVLSVLSASSSQYLRRWAGLLEQIPSSRAGAIADSDVTDPLAASAKRAAEDALIQDAFGDEYKSVCDAIEEHTQDSPYRGIQSALQSAMFSALITPDGRLRRALIEGVVNADLVKPAASALESLLRIEQGGKGSPLRDPGLRETAIFLLGRLRQPTSERITFLLATAENDRNDSIVRASLWCLGDIWRRGSRADRSLDSLGRLAVDATRPPSTRIAAAHVLAIIAHQDVHEESPRTDAKEVLTAVAEHELADPASIVVREVANWGTSFDPTRRLDPSDVLTISGLFEGNITYQDDLVLERQAIDA